jgi:hypothetical protein
VALLMAWLLPLVGLAAFDFAVVYLVHPQRCMLPHSRLRSP